MKSLAALKSIRSYLPEPFLCQGCILPCWNAICEQCLSEITPNLELIPSPTSELVALAPFLYAYQNTYTLIRIWKEQRGNLLRDQLFKIAPELKKALIDLEFDFLVPIPQSKKRSWKREQQSAEEVAKFCAKELAVPLFKILELQKETTPRVATLSAWERTYAPCPFRINENLFHEQLHLINKLESLVMNAKEIRILLVDDLITSGSTLSRAAETIHSLLPRAKIYGASLGYRSPKTK